MELIPLEELLREEQAYHAAVKAQQGIDSFCSRTEWLHAFHRAFMPESKPIIWRRNQSFVVLAESIAMDGQVFLTPLEPMWGFPSPLIGPESVQMLFSLLSGNRASPDLRIRHLILFGLPDDSAFSEHLPNQSGLTHQPISLEPTRRCVASLEGGTAGYLGRRSAGFRAKLRRALRLASDRKISFERITSFSQSTVGEFYAKVLDVEKRSWKGVSGQGANQEPMKTFYELILRRIGPAGHLRLILARHAGEAVGYIYGACIEGKYRGLQFSFDRRYSALSLGNVLQFRMIEWLCEDGAQSYDLGSVVPYKKRWAESTHLTRTVYLRPRIVIGSNRL